MLLQLIVFIIFGIIAGTFTGLIPGIHINLISSMLVSLSLGVIYFIEPIYLITFISSMAITHTFLDFIPSVILGCPDTDTELSILPGHNLLKKGQGYEAIILTAYGSLAAIFILILLAYPSVIFLTKTYALITKFIPLILGTIIFILVLLEKNKINSIFVVAMTGFLGLSVLNIKSLNEPFLPLLTGLFGGSNLILSIKNKIKIPKQIIKKPKPKLLKPLLGSIFASPIGCFLPGIGSGQAAIIGNTITLNKKDNKQFLVLLGATNTLVMGLSFISLYAISKTRTGTALAIKEIAGYLNTHTLILILSIAIATGIISFFLTKKLAKFFLLKLTKINYKKLSILTLIFLMIIITIFSGFLGLAVFIISTITGIYSISLKVRRTNMMGCLLIPTILWYLFQLH